MKGVSKARLMEIEERKKDSNKWKPIDENTPEDSGVFSLTNDVIVIEGYAGGNWVDGLNHDEIQPKAWQEMPPPKEQS